MSRETSTKVWRRSAESDRQAAKHLLDAGDYEACVFHCQQAAEKLLKAVIVKQAGKRPPHTHDFRALLDLISGIETVEIEEAVSSVGSYYVGSRHPLDAIDPSIFHRSLAESAVQKMDKVFEWFLAKINFDNE